jgi:NAD-dependent SIR2 family protein deacetylase
MKYFQCDKCKKQFQSELEIMTWKQSGQERTIDVCPVCRDLIQSDITTYKKSILNPIYDNK